MIDYLEDLLEEETAVELTGRPLVPVGRRKVPFREEDEGSLRHGKEPEGEGFAGKNLLQEGIRLTEAGRPSWGEDGGRDTAGAVRLLGMFNQAARAAGMVRYPEKTLTVTLPRETDRAVGLDLETIDRAVQRDARRYDGGFPLY